MNEASSDDRLLLLFTRDETPLEELVIGMIDVGMAGVTVVESAGLTSVLRQNMPRFAGIVHLLPTPLGSRIVMSITSSRLIEALRRYIDAMEPARRPLAVVVPILETFGRTPL